MARERSGTGKSTMTNGLLMTSKARGINFQSFKVGPNLLGPMHHIMVIGRPSRHLDTEMSLSCGPQALANVMIGADMAQIEGVMGIYDEGTPLGYQA